MADKKFVSGDSSDVEQVLVHLSPRASRLNRDRLMFLAGRASGETIPQPRRRIGLTLWAWSMTAVATVLLGVLLLHHPVPRTIHEIVYVEKPAATVPNAVVPGRKAATPRKTISKRRKEAAKFRLSGPLRTVNQPPTARPRLPEHPNYLQLRQFVLTYGVDAWLPPDYERTVAPTASPLTNRQLLRELLGHKEHEREPSGGASL